ncbi:MAG TPA: hypothetical protein VGJ84_13080 [Polyangiaceae bacterium]
MERINQSLNGLLVATAIAGIWPLGCGAGSPDAEEVGVTAEAIAEQPGGNGNGPQGSGADPSIGMDQVSSVECMKQCASIWTNCEGHQKSDEYSKCLSGGLGTCGSQAEMECSGQKPSAVCVAKQERLCQTNFAIVVCRQFASSVADQCWMDRARCIMQCDIPAGRNCTTESSPPCQP